MIGPNADNNMKQRELSYITSENAHGCNHWENSLPVTHKFKCMPTLY